MIDYVGDGRCWVCFLRTAMIGFQKTLKLCRHILMHCDQNLSKIKIRKLKNELAACQKQNKERVFSLESTPMRVVSTQLKSVSQTAKNIWNHNLNSLRHTLSFSARSGHSDDRALGHGAGLFLIVMLRVTNSSDTAKTKKKNIKGRWVEGNNRKTTMKSSWDQKFPTA